YFSVRVVQPTATVSAAIDGESTVVESPAMAPAPSSSAIDWDRQIDPTAQREPHTSIATLKAFMVDRVEGAIERVGGPESQRFLITEKVGSDLASAFELPQIE